MNVKTLIDQLPSFKIEDLYVQNVPYDPNDLRLIGSGLTGRIYAIGKDPYKILKYQQPQQSQNPCQQEAYNVLHPFTYYSTPYPLGRHILTIPNVISEAYIGGMITDLLERKYTINFPATYQVGYLPTDAASYITIDKLEPDLSQVIKSEADFLLMWFQILHALMVTQEMLNFTHYDLHAGNLLWQPLDPKVKISYPLKGRRIVVPSRGYMMKLSDFGLSVGKFKGTIVNPLPYNCVQKTYGVFNPYYDVVSFWGSLLIDVPSLQGNPLIQVFKNLDKLFLSEILRIFFDPPIDLGTYDEIVAWIKSTYFSVLVDGRSWWRPKDLDWVKFFHMKNCHQLLSELADLMIKLKLASQGSTQTRKGSADIIYLERLPEYKLDKLAPEVDYFTSHSGNVSVKIANGIQVNSYSISYRSLIKDYNLVPLPKHEQLCLTTGPTVDKTQYISEVIITPSLAIKNDYTFRLDCCKESLQDYLVLNKLDGAVINGGFFDIHKSYLPTAFFKNRRFSKNSIEIPDVYMRYFGMYHIGDDGILHIGQITESKFTAEQFEACGPLLVYNGKVVMTEDIIRTIHDNKMIFQCANPAIKGDTSKYLSPFNAKSNNCNPSYMGNVPVDVEIPNCTTITGGELSHAGNPNPRSMLISRIDEKGQYEVIFVVIEGRENRGDGMDMVELANFAVERYHANRAIGLDGGGSSNIVVKIPGNPVYYTVNQTKETKYPVGSVISFVKKSKD